MEPQYNQDDRPTLDVDKVLLGIESMPSVVVSMVVFRDNLYVATLDGVYVKGRDDQFIKLKIE